MQTPALVSIAAHVSVVLFVATTVLMLAAPWLIRTQKLGRRTHRALITFVEYVGHSSIEG